MATKLYLITLLDVSSILSSLLLGGLLPIIKEHTSKDSSELIYVSFGKTAIRFYDSGKII